LLSVVEFGSSFGLHERGINNFAIITTMKEIPGVVFQPTAQISIRILSCGNFQQQPSRKNNVNNSMSRLKR
jgi:hypothetical protein